MSLHGDLLAQARSLLRREPRRPKQASLRRAVSTAYYALFHLLIHEATRMLVSGAALDNLRKRVLGCDACQTPAPGISPPPGAASMRISPVVPSSVIHVPSGIREVASRTLITAGRPYSRAVVA